MDAISGSGGGEEDLVSAVIFFRCFRSSRRCFHRESVSSEANMVRRVVLGVPGGCVVDGVFIVGLDRGLGGIEDCLSFSLAESSQSEVSS